MIPENSDALVLEAAWYEVGPVVYDAVQQLKLRLHMAGFTIYRQAVVCRPYIVLELQEYKLPGNTQIRLIAEENMPPAKIFIITAEAGDRELISPPSLTWTRSWPEYFMAIVAGKNPGPIVCIAPWAQALIKINS